MSELAKALCAVMGRVRYVPETGRNQFHRYSYASDEDLLSVLQPAMAEAGLAMVPTAVAATTVEHSPDAKGKPQWRTELLVTYALMHASGESVTVQAPGCGIDGEDKGVYKAMTGALKYALRHTFLVPTGEDAEKHEAPRQQREQRREAPSGGGAKSGPALERLAAEQRREPPPPSSQPPSVGVGAATASGGGQPLKWTDAQRRAFCAELGRLDGAPTYDQVAAWCEANGRPRPSAMEPTRRQALLTWLSEAPNRAAVLAASTDTAQAEAGAA